MQRYKFIQSNFNALTLLVFVFFVETSGIIAQVNNRVTLEKIFFEGAFYQETVNKPKPLNDGENYTILGENGSIIRYDYISGRQADTLFNETMPGCRAKGRIYDYELSHDASRLLLATNTSKIYRNSFSADYYIYDMSDKSLTPLYEGGRQQLASFSPSGNTIAFIKDNNLYCKDLSADTIIQITFDGRENEIINGKPDWVYEEEFEFTKAYVWSPDGQKIAYYKFNESGVREFNITIYDSLYPHIFTYKYPKAGEENSKVSIHVYDLATGTTKIMDTGSDSDHYIPGIKWTNDPDVLCILKLNRLQNTIEVFLADVLTGSTHSVFTEENKYYISDITDDYLTFIDNNDKYIVMSERDGYMHLYLYSAERGLIGQITRGEWDVDRFIAFNPETGYIYYTSSETSPLQRNLYCIKRDGTGKKRITGDAGTNIPEFNNNYKYFINYNTTANTPLRITVHDSSGELLRVIEDNSELAEKIRSYGFAKKEFIKIPVEGGNELNAYIIKPAEFDESKKYPLLMIVYGAPGLQKVTDSWDSALPWYQVLSGAGYIVAGVDNRGTGARGEEFRKCTYMDLGAVETEDLTGAATYLGGLPYIDSIRIGIFGWSYGGYLVLSCLTRVAGVFSAGIAVAPVTDWRLYDNIYAERYMRTPQENNAGYERSSVLNYAGMLEGDLLLVHGTADDNVHLQHSVELVKRLVMYNKDFEMFFYPDRDHHIRGGTTRYDLYKRITDFILEKL